MPFKPFFTSSINGFGSSYYEVSGAVGAIQMATIFSEMEWNYHYINSQTRINFVKPKTSTTDLKTFYPTEIGIAKQIASYGPFRINLDKNGNPQPIVVSFIPYTQDIVGKSTGSFSFLLRTVDATGMKSNVEYGTYTQTSVTTYPASTNLKWYSLQTPSASYISSSMNISSSILQTKMNIPQQLKTRTTKSLDTFDSTKNVCLAYLDFYYTAQQMTGSIYSTAGLYGLYAREVNTVGDNNVY